MATLTGARPKDRNEQKIWEAQNKIPHAIRVPGTQRWISARFIYPFLYPAFAGALINQAQNEADPGNELGLPERFALASFDHIRGVVDELPSLQFVENSMLAAGVTDAPADTALNRAWDAASSSLVGAAWPNAVTRIAQALDPYERERYHEGSWNILWSKFFQRVPGVRHTLEIKTDDLTGEDIRRIPKGKGVTAEIVAGLGTFLMGSAAKSARNLDNPIVNEYARLHEYDTYKGDGTGVSPTYKKADDYNLPEGKVTEINRDVAKLSAIDMATIMSSPQYDQMTDNQKVKEIKKHLQNRGRQIWDRYKKDLKEEIQRPEEFGPTRPGKGPTALEAGLPIKPFAANWTPRQEIEYIDALQQGGFLNEWQTLDKTKERAKYEVQDMYYNNGGKYIYELYHWGTKDKDLLYKYLYDKYDKGTAWDLIGQMGGYENLLIQAGARKTRSLTQKDGSLKTIDKLFNLPSSGFGNAQKRFSTALLKIKPKKRQSMTIHDLLKMLR